MFDRIKIDPRVCEGKPTIRGLRITVDFVLKDQDNIYRNRFFVGAKLQYYVFQLTIEGSLARAGTSVDDRSGTTTPCMPSSTTTVCDATDQAGSQRTLTVSGGFDF